MTPSDLRNVVRQAAPFGEVFWHQGGAWVSFLPGTGPMVVGSFSDALEEQSETEPLLAVALYLVQTAQKSVLINVPKAIVLSCHYHANAGPAVGSFGECYTNPSLNLQAANAAFVVWSLFGRTLDAGVEDVG